MVQGAFAGSRFYFNLTEPVGKKCPNKLEDVELVRFGYFCMARNPKITTPLTPEEKRALSAMNTAGGYGPDLQDVIDQHQNFRKKAAGIEPDGKVSVARFTPADARSPFFDRKHLWIIATLNNSMRQLFTDTYPRIDQEVECGPACSAAVLKIFA